MIFATLDRLLREPRTLLSEERSAEEEARLARALIAIAAIGAAIFGAGIGLYRGGPQVLYAAIKLPLGVLLTAAICTPALSGLRWATQGRLSPRRDALVVLSALALGCVMVAATTPLLVLGVVTSASYHTLVLIVVGVCGVCGLFGLAHLSRGLERRHGLTVAMVCLFAVVGLRVTWSLRPYLVRPRTPDVPIVRALEGSFFDSITRSSRSAVGVHDRPSAPLPEESAP